MHKTTYHPHSAPNALSIQCYYSLFEMIFRPDYTFAGESHDCWEIVCVLEGSIFVTADDRIFHLSKNSVIIHKPMEFHKFHINSQEDTRLFIFSFDLSGRHTDKLENKVLELSLSQKNALSDILSYLRKETGLRPQITYDCIQTLTQNTVKYQTVTCMLELWLLSLLSSPAAIPTSSGNAESMTFKRAVQTMEHQITSWISVDEIAKECHVSTSYLKKVFTKYAGLGVHRYFLNLKMIHASKMLKSGKSVSEVSDTLAFCNANYFSNVFRKHMGVSPSSYKKQP